MKFTKGEYCVLWRRIGTGAFGRLSKSGYLFEYGGRQYGVAKERCDLVSKTVWVVTDIASGMQIGINEYTRDRAVAVACEQADRAVAYGYFETPEYMKTCEDYEALPKVYS